MKKLLFALLLCAGFALPALGQSNPPLTVTEPDGSPRVTGVTTLRFSNGSVSCSGKVCTVTTGGGGGGTPGGANTQVQYNNAGSFGGVAGFTFNGTAKITLGVAGSSVGAIGFNNATSGQITLQPVTGALGTVTLSLPAATDTLVGRATTDTLSNKTLASPAVTGNISAEATSLLFFGGNYARYINTTGPAFYDVTTDKILTFNVQSLTDNRTVTWPDTALTVAGINVANSWADGVKQTFNPDATTAGFNVGSVAGDPSTPANGDIWYDSTANELTARINGANVALGAGGSGITVGTTTITSGTNTRVLYNNAGVVGEYTVTGTAGNVVLSQSPTITTGLTLSSATLTMSGNISAAAWTTSGIRYSSVPGTLTDTTSSGTVAAAYTNNYGGNTIAASSSTTFTDYYTTFMTQPTAGSNVTFTRRWALGLSGALRENIDAIGTTSTDGIVLENTTAAAAGAQQYSPRLRLTGQGWKTNATAASQTVDWAVETRPVQGAANPTSTLNFLTQVNAGGYTSRVQIGSAGTTGTLNLTVTDSTSTPHITFNGETNTGIMHPGGTLLSMYVAGFEQTRFQSNQTIVRGQLSLGNTAASGDIFLTRLGAAALQMGNTDAASPVAQTLSVQNVVGGTSNTAGVNWTFAGSRGTGTGAGGSIIFQTAPAGGSGTSQNALATALTIRSTGATLATLPYGELYETSGSTAITVTTAGTYYQWASTTAGTSSGVTASASTDNLTVDTGNGGKFLITATMSFTATANSVTTVGVFVNGSLATNCMGRRKLNATGDVGELAISCVATVTDGQTIDLRVTSDNNGDTVTPVFANLSANRIGN